MRQLTYLLILLFLNTACQNHATDTDQLLNETFECESGLMKAAWYEQGKDEAIPAMKALQQEFLIVVDTHFQATNFISLQEVFLRESSINLDTSDLSWRDDWEKLTLKQKLKKLQQEKRDDLKQADAEHILNNQGQQQVWIINNSKDTVSIQMQDGSFICVLQAKTKGGTWYPIQYWRFSTCGNSYYLKKFPPKTANSFVTKLPNEGDFKTKLRYKLLGLDKFYYSNEFDGRINPCEFVEDSSTFIDRGGKIQAHFKLDSLIRLRVPF